MPATVALDPGFSWEPCCDAGTSPQCWDGVQTWTDDKVARSISWWLIRGVCNDVTSCDKRNWFGKVVMKDLKGECMKVCDFYGIWLNFMTSVELHLNSITYIVDTKALEWDYLTLIFTGGGLQDVFPKNSLDFFGMLSTIFTQRKRGKMQRHPAAESETGPVVPLAYFAGPFLWVA